MTPEWTSVGPWKTRFARNKNAAWEFIRFLTSDWAFRTMAENDRMVKESQGRLYMPSQCPVKKLNDEFYRKYVLGNPRVPEAMRTPGP